MDRGYRNRSAPSCFSLLIGSLLAIFGALGFVNIRLHRQHLEAATLQAPSARATSSSAAPRIT